MSERSGAGVGVSPHATLSPSAQRLTLLVCSAALLSALMWPRVTAEPALWGGVVAAFSASLLFYAWVAARRTRAEEPWGVVWAPRRVHLIQCVAQGLVYLGWCAHWEVARWHLPLLCAQVGFAYLVDLCAVWRSAPVYRLGFGPIPIVLSTNLFLFFKDEHYYWQWPMIALAILSKDLFRWRRDARSTHIFNPSAIALSVTALALIWTGEMGSSWGEAIARTHASGPWSYELIFAAGLLVTVLFGVGITIVSAVFTSLALGALYFEQTGAYRYLDTAIPAAVFLGMNLLVTDPASSPKGSVGRVIYGALYGLSVFILYGVLRSFERPPLEGDPGLTLAFCDKLLAVPLLNLLTPAIERATVGLSAWGERLTRQVMSDPIARLTFALIWAASFAGWVRPQLTDHPGRRLSVWIKACDETPAPQRAPFACANRDRIYRQLCDQGDLQACHQLAFSWERGEGAAASNSVAATLYQRACDGGLLLSCHHLGGLFVLEAEQTKERAWITQATPLLERACEGEVWGACARLAAIKNSQWTEGDARREVWSLWERACEHGEPFSCFELGQRSLLPLPLRAQRCMQGDTFACLSAERAQRKMSETPSQGPLTSARRELTMACQGELWVACANVAWMMWRGDGGSKDPRQALRLMTQSCEGGLKDACARAQVMRSQVPR